MRIFFSTILFLAAVFLWHSCTKIDDFITDPAAQLEFSVDTLRFDTVFTEVGSATRFIRVYNRHRKPIQISKIFLGDGERSFFRLNIDGLPGNTGEDIKIPANDSIYIFAEVTVDPDQPLSASPFVIEDDLVFETNGNEQKVLLEAWGQNANYIPSRFGAGTISSFSACNFGDIVWDDPKPYVIYGFLLVDECTLVIPAGAQVYFHGGLAQTEVNGERVNYNDGRLFIRRNGKLKIQGTKENPVTLQGDRLESEFQEVAAQWSGINFEAGSRGNEISYAIIKNSIIGVFADSATTLSLNNTHIYNTAGNVLTGRHCEITAENCLFESPGRSGYCVALIHGGKYRFDYCTMASYGVDQSAVGLSNFTCYDPDNTICDLNPIDARFRNCIITGSRNNEIDLVDIRQREFPTDFMASFENCVVRLEELDKLTDFQ
ncbi:MAG: hypothetical protein AAFO94_09455, partial [Bacteroidota bacterium]